MRFCFIFLLFWVVPKIIPAQSNADKIIQNFIKNPAIDHAHVGFSFINLDKKTPLLNYQSQKAFIPASTHKLVSTAAAWLYLGKQFRFETKVFLKGKRNGDEWDGWLVIKGGGDPGLASGIAGYSSLKTLTDELLAVLKKAGIKRFSKGIWIDPYYLPYQHLVHDNIAGGVIWEDIGNYYAAGLFGLNLNQNKFEIVFHQRPLSGDSVKIKEVVPSSIISSLNVNVVSGPKGSGDLTYISPHLMDGKILVQGTIPPGNGLFTVKGSIANPPQFAGNYLQDLLISNGIVCPDISIAHYTDTAASNTIYSYKSPILLEVITEANQQSNNLFADGVFRAFGMLYSLQNDRLAACDALKKFWTEKGIDATNCRFTDGSGLSRTNLQTPGFQTAVIQYVYDSGKHQEFIKSLAIAGKRGTLSTFLVNSPLSGKLWGKSGSMSGVLAYCGVFTNAKNENIGFSILLNHFSSKSGKVKEAVEALLLNVYEM